MPGNTRSTNAAAAAARDLKMLLSSIIDNEEVTFEVPDEIKEARTARDEALKEKMRTTTRTIENPKTSQTNRKRAQNKLLQLKVEARANAEKDRLQDEEMERQAGQADIEEDEISDGEF
jgi:predicted secreted protein